MGQPRMRLGNKWDLYRGQDVGGTFWQEMLNKQTQVSACSCTLAACSQTGSFQGYHEYIDENLPPESPYLYGLHPNAEIGFLTVTSEKLFRTVLEMQPKETDAGAGTGVSREEKVGPFPNSPPTERGQGRWGGEASAQCSQGLVSSLAWGTRNSGRQVRSTNWLLGR
jgi:hypothetical protein